MLALTVVVALGIVAWFSFTIGRVSSDRTVNLNHHRMMMLLTRIRTQDGNLAILTDENRKRLDSLLDDYERFDLDD